MTSGVDLHLHTVLPLHNLRTDKIGYILPLHRLEGTSEAAHVSTLLNTVRRKYRTITEATVLETLDSNVNGNVDSEIDFLRSVL